MSCSPRARVQRVACRRTSILQCSVGSDRERSETNDLCRHCRKTACRVREPDRGRAGARRSGCRHPAGSNEQAARRYPYCRCCVSRCPRLPRPHHGARRPAGRRDRESPRNSCPCANGATSRCGRERPCRGLPPRRKADRRRRGRPDPRGARPGRAAVPATPGAVARDPCGPHSGGKGCRDKCRCCQPCRCARYGTRCQQRRTRAKPRATGSRRPEGRAVLCRSPYPTRSDGSDR